MKLFNAMSFGDKHKWNDPINDTVFRFDKKRDDENLRNAPEVRSAAALRTDIFSRLRHRPAGSPPWIAFLNDVFTGTLGLAAPSIPRWCPETRARVLCGRVSYRRAGRGRHGVLACGISGSTREHSWPAAGSQATSGRDGGVARSPQLYHAGSRRSSFRTGTAAQDVRMRVQIRQHAGRHDENRSLCGTTALATQVRKP